MQVEILAICENVIDNPASVDLIGVRVGCLLSDEVNKYFIFAQMSRRDEDVGRERCAIVFRHADGPELFRHEFEIGEEADETRELGDHGVVSKKRVTPTFYVDFDPKIALKFVGTYYLEFYVNDQQTHSIPYTA